MGWYPQIIRIKKHKRKPSIALFWKVNRNIKTLSQWERYVLAILLMLLLKTMVEEPLLIFSIALDLYNLFLDSQQIKTQRYVKESTQSSQGQPDFLPLPQGWPGYLTCIQPYGVGSKSLDPSDFFQGGYIIKWINHYPRDRTVQPSKNRTKATTDPL